MALKILLGSDIGLLSLATIGLVVLMAAFFVWFFTSNIRKGQKK